MITTDSAGDVNVCFENPYHNTYFSHNYNSSFDYSKRGCCVNYHSDSSSDNWLLSAQKAQVDQ